MWISCCSPLLLSFLSFLSLALCSFRATFLSRKSFKPGCLWVSQSHRILGAGNGALEMVQSSPSCQGRARFGVDQALVALSGLIVSVSNAATLFCC